MVGVFLFDGFEVCLSDTNITSQDLQCLNMNPDFSRACGLFAEISAQIKQFVGQCSDFRVGRCGF